MNEQNEIMVSVCCLAYNQKLFIRQAIDGFLMQETTFPFEVIIHDDASTDGTDKIIREYAEWKPELIRPVFQTENQFSKAGIYPHVQFVYPLMRGQYVAFCDGDDYWSDPQKLQKQVEALEANRSCSLCYHDYRVLTGNTFDYPFRKAPRDFTSDEIIGMQLTDFQIATSTMMFRNYYGPETRKDFEEFRAHYMTVVLLGTFGGAKYVKGILPSVYRKHDGASWASLPRSEIDKRTEMKKRRLMELFIEKGNEHWVNLRRGVR